MQKMTREEAKAFIQVGTRTGKLAVVRADGRPHVTPIWFVLDGDTLVFTTWRKALKAKCMQRDPRVTICVDIQEPPYAFVMVEGTAEIQPNAADKQAWSTRIARRYMGDDLAETYGERNSVEGEWLVSVKINNIVARKDVAGW
jgi:PPOX class probable F420-dependent enzyme